MAAPHAQLTQQNYDLQFGTNVLGESRCFFALEVFQLIFLSGHIYLTQLLLPALLLGAKSSPDGKARVVNTSSSGHLFATGLDFSTFKDGPARNKGFSMFFYLQSKLVSEDIHVMLTDF